jgi:hypothetical protein
MTKLPVATTMSEAHENSGRMLLVPRLRAVVPEQAPLYILMPCVSADAQVGQVHGDGEWRAPKGVSRSHVGGMHIRLLFE